MRSDLLHVVGVLNNPYRWQARIRNFRAWEDAMLDAGVKLTTGELAYGDRPFELPDREGVTRVRFRSRHVLWHKENLGNRTVQQLPADARYVALIDTDITFARRDWAAETVHILQLHPIAQISSELVMLGPRHEHLSHGPSLVELHHRRLTTDHPGMGRNGNGNGHRTALVAMMAAEPREQSEGYYAAIRRGGDEQLASSADRPAWLNGYPGGAWAYRREAFDAIGGLLDCCIAGAGDHHMAYALLDYPDPLAVPSASTGAYSRRVVIWRERAQAAIRRDVGVVPGTGFHFWHGTRADRRYPARWQILTRNGFDPDLDLSYDGQGILQLTGNKPALRDDLRTYFLLRDEDVNAVL